MDSKFFERVGRQLYAAYRVKADGPPWNGLTHAQQQAWVLVAEKGLSVYGGAL